MKKLYIPAILACCIFAGLSTITQAEPVKAAPAVQADLIAVKEWKLTQIGDQVLGKKLTGVSILFAEEGKLSGSGGVNRFGGVYESKADGQISIKNIFATEMAALDEDIMNLETRYFQLLAKAKSAQMSDGNLVIECEDKDGKSIKLLFAPLMK